MTYDDCDGAEQVSPLEAALNHLNTLADTTELRILAALDNDRSFMCAQDLALALGRARRGLRAIVPTLEGELAGRSSSPEARREAYEEWRSRK